MSDVLPCVYCGQGTVMSSGRCQSCGKFEDALKAIPLPILRKMLAQFNYRLERLDD